MKRMQMFASGSMLLLCSLSGYWSVSMFMGGRYLYGALALIPFLYTGTSLAVQMVTPTKIVSALGVRENG